MSEDKIDAGTSYVNYPYYSLYGWRTNPPNKYPQSTINTPFDVTMRECTPWCNQTQDPKQCQNICRLKATAAQGIEEFGFEYSHGSPRHRFTGGDSDDQSCFYY